jgi:S1-C subfamily serine protease/Tfp pilus assembly protein PilF
MADERITAHLPATGIPSIPPADFPPTAAQQPAVGNGAIPRLALIWLAFVAVFALVLAAGYGVLIRGGTTPKGPENRSAAAAPAAHVSGDDSTAIVQGEGQDRPGSSTNASSALAADAVYARCSPAVVQVESRTDAKGRTASEGSGFLVSAKDLIATNYHVIKDAYSAHVVFVDKTELQVLGVVAMDPEADVAIIKLAGQAHAQPLELAGGDLPPVGTKVYAIGSPLGVFANTLSDGLVSSHRGRGTVPYFSKMPAMIQTTAPISHGSSGGPLLRGDGKVAGVMTLTFASEGENLNFAVPASHVARLLLRCEGNGQITQFPVLKPETHLLTKSASFYYNRGLVLSKKKEYDKAIEDFDEAIRLDPTDALGYYSRGDTWYKMKFYGRAITDYDEAIRLNPNPPFLYLSRAHAWSKKKDYDRALLDFEEAIRRDPDFTFGYSNFAWLLATCDEARIRDGERAMQLAIKACELTAWKRGWELSVLAAAYAEAGHFSQAEGYQRKALEDPACVSARNEFRRRLELYSQKKPYREYP